MTKSFTNLLGGAIVNKQIDEDAVRGKIIIRESLRNFIPPLSKDEFSQLETNIVKEGVRDPLILWQIDNSYVLIDGHNRYDICKKYNLTFPFKVLPFKEEKEVMDWMINHQLGRRNLTKEQASYLRGLRYQNEKAQGKRSDLTSGQIDQKSNSSTAARLAEEYGVSEVTIRRDGEFAEAIDKIGRDNPQLKNEILTGKVKIRKKDLNPHANKSELQSDSMSSQMRRYTSKKIIEISFEYIKSESRPFNEVCVSLGLEVDISSDRFFMAWIESKNAIEDKSQ